MKRSNFTALVMGTVSALLFALGICMAMLPELGVLVPGLGFGCVGIVLGLITLLVWRKMEHKPPVHISGKTLLMAFLLISGVLTLGFGICLIKLWVLVPMGVAVGIAGIIVLLCFVSLCKGVRTEEGEEI